MKFRVEVKTIGPTLGYSWSVTPEMTFKGQGTSEIAIMTDRSLDGQSITATVKVDGLAQDCERTVSETAGISSGFHVSPVDVFVELPKNDQRGRHDLFFHELRDNPSNIAFVDIYHLDRKKAEAKLRFYVIHVRFRKFDLSRLIFRLGVAPEPRTVLWRIPEGYDPWAWDRCTVIAGKDLK